MSALMGQGMLQVPYLRGREGREGAKGHTWRKPIPRLLLKLGAILLIILLLIGVAWVIPVASQALCALAGIAPSFVAVRAIL